MRLPIFRTVVIAAALGLASTFVTASADRTPGPPPSPAVVQTTTGANPAADSTHQAVINRYCITCHNDKLKTASLSLQGVSVDRPTEHADVWEKVVRKLRTASMPPAGLPRPDAETYTSLATHLETALDRAAAANPYPGRPVVRRLNRTEYTNAVRDLLALEIDGASLLPADDSGEGFDNIADVLSISPTLLERYVSAARRISLLAVGERAPKPIFTTHTLPSLLMQDRRMSEDLPFGSRGGIAVRHHFPADGEYLVELKLQKAITGDARGYFRGLLYDQQIDVRLDGARVSLLTAGGTRKGTLASATAYGDPDQEDHDWVTADEHLRIRFQAKAGTRLLQVAFVADKPDYEGVYQPELPAAEYREERQRYYMEGDAALDSVTIRGPFNPTGAGDTPSRRRLFVCQPKSGQRDEGCARNILLTLTRRAFRRPVTNADVEPLLALYRQEKDFESGIRVAVAATLVSPDFLFRIEHDPSAATAGTAYRVSDLDLASRLSFFLWSSIPDDELLNAAAAGTLKQPAALDQQVRRMVGDRRVRQLVDNFAGQWLLLRDIADHTPDPEEFRDFDENLREAIQQETLLFFENLVREDRSVLDLLNADYTFVNERLARHYGIPHVRGSHFRRVTLADESRRGLLGQASLLMMTSYVTRTSAVLRGKWVLENVLGTPPPPPPDNVPALKDRGENGKILSVRQQMEVHRSNPACAGCHRIMDPIGFALENFDAVGRWRTTEGPANTPIDSSGTLMDGMAVKGPVDLRKALLRYPEQFVTTVTEKLLTYALGRAIDYRDAPTVRKIVREAAASDYRFSTILMGIVRSTPFQMKRAREL